MASRSEVREAASAVSAGPFGVCREGGGGGVGGFRIVCCGSVVKDGISFAFFSGGGGDRHGVGMVFPVAVSLYNPPGLQRCVKRKP